MVIQRDLDLQRKTYAESENLAAIRKSTVVKRERKIGRGKQHVQRVDRDFSRSREQIGKADVKT